MFRLLSIMTALLTGPAWMCAQQFNLRNLSVESGLAQSQVTCIAQDSRGLVWMGTSGGGLSCFDGISFRNYAVRDGLPGNFVNAVAEDSSGFIWTGTSAGLARFNGKQFIPVLHEGKNIRTVNDICAAGDRKTIWVTSGTQLFRISLPECSVKRMRLPDAMTGYALFGLHADAKGRLWIASDNGLLRLTDKSFTRFGKVQGMGSRQCRSVNEDSKGRIWVTTYGGGVSWMDEPDKSGDSLQVFRTWDKSKGFPDDVVLDVMEDRSGRLWFATLHAGAIRFDGEGFTRFDESVGLKTDHVLCLQEDDWGGIWLGTSGGGASRFGGDQFVHLTEKSGLPGERVYAISGDAQGTLWLSTSAGGVTRYDRDTFITWKAAEGLTNETSKCLHTDAKGNLWIGTEGDGLYRFDSVRAQHWGKENGIGVPFVKDILTDEQGQVWIATAGSGICRLESADDKTCSCLTRDDGLPSLRYNCLFAGRDGIIWAGSSEKGITGIRKKGIIRITAADGLCSEDVRDLGMDNYGNLWAGTAAGLARIRLNGDSREVQCYGITEGLSSENIYLVWYDASTSTLWTGNEKGVDQLLLSEEGVLRQVRHFGSKEGFTGIETCRGAVYRSSSGSIWFGTMNGATQFNPGFSSANRIPPRLRITGMKVFYDDVPVADNQWNRLPWQAVPETLELPWNRNMLSFSFIGIDHRNAGNVSYSFKLEGMNQDWSPQSHSREAVFTNLAPGRYTFLLKSCNEDGVWNDVPLRFSFVITPPLWATWWFRLLLVGTIGGAVLLIFRLRVRQVRRQAEESQRKLEMEKRVLELEQKALMLQMNPHFIFNALNSIKGFIALNEHQTAQQNILKFAGLMRLILDNSRASRILLEKEITTLNLYLSLEQLNRGDAFRFDISCDPAIDPSRTYVPPMIIQPFVENAVQHGLSGVNAGGQVSIRFTRMGDRLTVTVQDNGIGREKAREMKEGSSLPHRSAGIAVTEERLRLIDPGLKPEFEDLRDENGKPAGTRVTLQFPFEED